MPKLRQPKHETFAREIVAGLGPVAAYTAAGFKPHRANGSRLMRRPEVAERITELQKEAAARSEITAERVLMELGRIAFVSMASYFEIDAETSRVRVRDIAALPPELGAALAEIRLDDEGRPIFKLHPKMPALELLAEYTGLTNKGASAPDASAVINLFGRPMHELTDAELAAIATTQNAVGRQLLTEIDGNTRGLPGQMSPPTGVLRPSNKPKEPVE